MPPWERFRDLCLAVWADPPWQPPPSRDARLHHHGPGLRRSLSGTRVPCPGVSARQRADLFVGGLPDYIRVDVEMREPGTCRRPLRTSLRAAPSPCSRSRASSACPCPDPPRRPPPAAPRGRCAAGPPAPTRPFKRLTAAEQLERRRRGLCFNCDEKYAPGHTCPRLFYLETVDDADVEALTAELAAATVTEAGVTTYAPVDASAFVVSLHAMAGIKTAKTMLLPVTINGERLTALVDTGSTHNFLSSSAMRRLALQPAGAETYSVTVANGDRLTCQGVARQVPVLVGDEPFSIDSRARAADFISASTS
ncbi:hypothetical protein QYE76_020129 [Lolium multiflorum]|uniref:Uncharacterized protein n=1 Tax=Lolium multiflorum TaxID=4521 RepID=A0AAD8VNW7_LOLMU|nr:hypothetical protein QYE76_020129 [Lolium multiflorum]